MRGSAYAYQRRNNRGDLEVYPVEAIAALSKRLLAFSSHFTGITLWDIDRGISIGSRTEFSISDMPTHVLAAEIETGELAVGFSGGLIEVLDQIRLNAVVSLASHAGRVTALAIMPDSTLAAAYSDRSIRIWDPPKAKEIARIDVDAEIRAFAIIPPTTDGQPTIVVAGDSLGTVHWIEFAS